MKLFPIVVKHYVNPKTRELMITFHYLGEDGNIYIDDVYNNIPNDFVTKSVQEFPQGAISKMTYITGDEYENLNNVSIDSILHNYNPFPKVETNVNNEKLPY